MAKKQKLSFNPIPWGEWGGRGAEIIFPRRNCAAGMKFCL